MKTIRTVACLATTLVGLPAVGRSEDTADASLQPRVVTADLPAVSSTSAPPGPTVSPASLSSATVSSATVSPATVSRASMSGAAPAGGGGMALTAALVAPSVPSVALGHAGMERSTLPEAMHSSRYAEATAVRRQPPRGPRPRPREGSRRGGFALYRADRLRPPSRVDEPRLTKDAPGDRLDWSIFDRAMRLEEVPSYSRVSQLPLFYLPPPQETKLEHFMWKIAERKLYREVRSHAKGEWRRMYRDDPSMNYDDYEGTLVRVNRIGRSRDLFEGEYYSTHLKQDLFKRSSWEGEEDFDLLRVGPMIVTDTGSMRMDFGRVLAFFGLAEAETQAGGPESTDDARLPVLADEGYRVKTAVRLRLDPLEAFDQDPTWFVDRYGLDVEVDWLSDVLGLEIMTTEVELEVERQGDFAAVVNFVFKTRS